MKRTIRAGENELVFDYNNPNNLPVNYIEKIVSHYFQLAMVHVEMPGAIRKDVNEMLRQFTTNIKTLERVYRQAYDTGYDSGFEAGKDEEDTAKIDLEKVLNELDIKR